MTGPIFLRRAIRAVCGFVLFISVAAAQELSPLADSVKARFVAQAAKGFDDFRVVETFSRRGDWRDFFRKALSVDVLADSEEFQIRDVVVEDTPPKTKAHLGILIVRYKDRSSGERILAGLTKQGEFFRDTKVLTKFVSIPIGGSVLVLYSETVLNDRVQSFLSNASSAFGEASRNQ